MSGQICIHASQPLQTETVNLTEPEYKWIEIGDGIGGHLGTQDYAYHYSNNYLILDMITRKINYKQFSFNHNVNNLWAKPFINKINNNNRKNYSSFDIRKEERRSLPIDLCSYFVTWSRATGGWFTPELPGTYYTNGDGEEVIIGRLSLYIDRPTSNSIPYTVPTLKNLNYGKTIYRHFSKQLREPPITDLYNVDVFWKLNEIGISDPRNKIPKGHKITYKNIFL